MTDETTTSPTGAPAADMSTESTQAEASVEKTAETVQTPAPDPELDPTAAAAVKDVETPPAAAPAPSAEPTSLEIELDKDQKPGEPQQVRLRAIQGSHRLGVVIRRRDGKGWTAQRLTHRAMLDITLEAGDTLAIVNLEGEDLRSFMHAAGILPAETAAGGEQ